MELPVLTSVGTSLCAFQNIVYGFLEQYVYFSFSIGGDIAKHSCLVKEAFKAQLEYLKRVDRIKSPTPAEIKALIKNMSDSILRVQEFPNNVLTCEYYNHLRTICESIPALGWVIVTPNPTIYIRDLIDTTQLYTNRIVKEWRLRDSRHVYWVNAWLHVLYQLESFVYQYHTTGLVWGRNEITVLQPAYVCGAYVYLAPQSSINQRNQDLLTEYFNKMYLYTPNTSARNYNPPDTSSTSIDNPPSCVHKGKTWFVKHQRSTFNLIIKDTEINDVVHFYNCIDSSVAIKGKIDTIMVDSCKNCRITFDTIIGKIEFINCDNVQMQVLGEAPRVSIDKTNGCLIYLSNYSLDVEIISYKSSGMKVYIPTVDGDFDERVIPEEYRTVLLDNKELSTTVIKK